MSQTINIPNFSSANLKEQAKLDADANIGVTALTVSYADNFAIADYILIGTPGGESSELRIVNTGVNTTTIPITAATSKLHNRYDTIYKLFGNQLKIYRALDVNGSQPSDSSFSAYGSPVAININQIETEYTDATGNSSYWYKFTYFNSTTSAESALADSSAVRGGNIGNYCSIESIRNEAGLQNARFITNAIIDTKRQAAQAYINATLAGTYVVPFSEPINALIIDITKVLAAGWLLTDNYGPTATLNTNQGQAKIDYVLGKIGQVGMLERINNGSIKLVGVDGAGTNTTSPGLFGGYPNATTATSDIDGNPSPYGFKRTMRY